MTASTADIPGANLDPQDWSRLRLQGHRMLDDIFDHMQGLRDGPLWRAPPDRGLSGPPSCLPREPSHLAEVHASFLRDVLPYSSGNAHPGFMGWVQGGGAPVGMLAEMLAAGLNINAGGRNHMGIEVEREVLGWTREMFGFPKTANGLFVTGASAANHIGVLVARTRALGSEVRRHGLRGARLTAYASTAAHGCLARAMEMTGLGADALRKVPVDAGHQIDIGALRAAIERDRALGCTPFLIVGNAGTVDIGATDDLAALADLAATENLHFHVDGAFGALGVLSPEIKPRLRGLDRADSLAFDWHKWGQAPYDAGFSLIRDGALLHATFAADAAYLQRAPRGLAAGDWWPCDFGPDLSRGFRALKVWFMLKTYGSAAIGHVVAHSCAMARLLAERVAAVPELELLAPVPMNIVNFGWRGNRGDERNAETVMALHEAGRVAPSLTEINGRKAIRAAFVNHRTDERDVAALIDGVRSLGFGDLIDRAAA